MLDNIKGNTKQLWSSNTGAVSYPALLSGAHRACRMGMEHICLMCSPISAHLGKACWSFRNRSCAEQGCTCKEPQLKVRYPECNIKCSHAGTLYFRWIKRQRTSLTSRNNYLQIITKLTFWGLDFLLLKCQLPLYLINYPVKCQICSIYFIWCDAGMIMTTRIFFALRTAALTRFAPGWERAFGSVQAPCTCTLCDWRPLSALALVHI